MNQNIYLTSAGRYSSAVADKSGPLGICKWETTDRSCGFPHNRENQEKEVKKTMQSARHGT
jgi:hypothetical protein